jgi:ADP-ribosylglycohydrolase
MHRIREWLAETDGPERAIVSAANRTRDSDTVASMTGQLVGARGASAP